LHNRKPIKGNELCSLTCLLSATAVTVYKLYSIFLQAKNGITSAARAIGSEGAKQRLFIENALFFIM
jgi:hypothetical protein